MGDQKVGRHTVNDALGEEERGARRSGQRPFLGGGVEQHMLTGTSQASQ
jgi:hypothetical protein